MLYGPTELQLKHTVESKYSVIQPFGELDEPGEAFIEGCLDISLDRFSGIEDKIYEAISCISQTLDTRD